MLVSSFGLEGTGRLTALVVEDEPHLQKAMSAELARLDFCVLAASHFDAAVRYLTAYRTEVVSIDIGLPNKSGYELCEHIRRRFPLEALPILMTSEYGSPQERAYAEDAGASAFLRKPFAMPEFVRSIQSLTAALRWKRPRRIAADRGTSPGPWLQSNVCESSPFRSSFSSPPVPRGRACASR